MTGRRSAAFFAVFVAAEACVLLGLSFAGRWGCAPSTFVVGLAFAFVPYAGVLANSESAVAARWKTPVAASLALLLGFGFVFAPPLLSDDLYRYLWEGRLWLEGFNPYHFAPDDLMLTPLRDDLWAGINNKPLASIYPPLSQLLFILAAWFGGKVWTLKLLALCVHVAAVAAFARISKSARAPLALGLNPLLLSESALNGHFDILCGLALLVAARWLAQHRYLRAGLATCAAVALKLVGLLLLPLFARRPKALLGTAFGAAVVVAPLALSRALNDPVSGAGQFATRWRGNESVFALIDWLIRQFLAGDAAGLVARLVVAAVMLLLCALVLRRALPAPAAARALLWAALLLSPQVHPWYLAWLLPLEIAAGGSAGLIWSAAVLCAYAPLDLWLDSGVWRMPVWLQAFEYVVVTVALIADPRRPSLAGASVEQVFST
ncbi:MAG: glycosyltransferase 87 family protein [Polyangiales bacterium]